MIHILTDSTVFRSDPRREKAAFQSLERLAAGKHVTLHIPEIVRREFLSNEEKLHQENAKAIQDALRNLGKRPLDATGKADLKKVADASADLAAKLKDASTKEFSDWMKSVSAVDHPIDPAHGARVMDAYFAGTAPFKEKKNRIDIPDSFVWQALQDLSKKQKPLYVVSGDAGIRDPLQGNADFVVFASLEELIASVPVQALLKTHYASANLSALLALLPLQTEYLKDAIESPLADELAWKVIGDDDSEPTVTGVDEPKDLVVDVDDAVDHGSGLVVVPFKLKVECLVEFAIDKSRFHAMSDEDSEGISISVLNDHRYSAEESRIVAVEGNLSIQVDPAKLQEMIDEQTLIAVLKAGKISIDSIEEKNFVYESQ